MGRIMTRPKKLRDNRMDTEKDERVLPHGEASPIGMKPAVVIQPKQYSPPNCSMCTALRPIPEKSYVYVYHTRRDSDYILHYCKCRFCNNTFKEVERVK